jgi:hypothetical protein
VTKDWVFLADIALAHQLLLVQQQQLTKHGIMAASPPSTYPNLQLCNFYLFFVEKGPVEGLLLQGCSRSSSSSEDGAAGNHM